jgi:hypothetical protein
MDRMAVTVRGRGRFSLLRYGNERFRRLSGLFPKPGPRDIRHFRSMKCLLFGSDEGEIVVGL